MFYLSLILVLTQLRGFTSCSWQMLVDKSTVDAGATLRLQMLNFRNPSEKDYGGSCCDTWCWTDCDHIFRFALDLGSRYRLSDAVAVRYFKVHGALVRRQSS